MHANHMDYEIHHWDSTPKKKILWTFLNAQINKGSLTLIGCNLE